MHHKSTPVDPLKLTSDKRGINEKEKMDKRREQASVNASVATLMKIALASIEQNILDNI